MYITEFDIQGKTIRIEPIAKRVVIRIKNGKTGELETWFSMNRPFMEEFLRKVRETMDELDQSNANP